MAGWVWIFYYISQAILTLRKAEDLGRMSLSVSGPHLLDQRQLHVLVPSRQM